MGGAAPRAALKLPWRPERTDAQPPPETSMLRTIFTIGAFALLGLFALKFLFGVFGVALALLLTLLVLAVKIAIVGLVVYVVVSIFSPDTARRWREKWS
jgi:hypothetical protein